MLNFLNHIAIAIAIFASCLTQEQIHAQNDAEFRASTMNAYECGEFAGEEAPLLVLSSGIGTAAKTPKYLKRIESVAVGAAAKGGITVLEGAVKSNYGRFVSKIPANAKSSATFKQLKDGNYIFEATSPGIVPGSSALYQKWVNPQGETFKMIKTKFAPDGSIIHIKPKF